MVPTLNDDVMLEILHWFVSLDDLGPYTLFHVSNAWRAILLQTPSLWTWITLDCLDGDLEERAWTSIHMSGSLPLRFRIQLRGGTLPDIDWLNPFLHRADVLIMHLPETKKKTISYEVVFRRIRSFLTRTEWKPGLRVVWMRDGAVEGVKPDAFSQRIGWFNHSSLSSGRLLRNVFATRIGIDSHQWQDQDTITNLISATQNLTEIRLYGLPTNFEEVNSHEPPGELIHLSLRLFQIGTGRIKATTDSGTCEHTLRFAAYLKVQVEHLTIQDSLDCILSTISRIGSYIQPETLTLYPQDIQWRLTLTIHSPLNKLFRLNVDLAEFDQVISEEGFPSMAEAIYSLILNIPTIRICRLILAPCTFSYAHYLLPLYQNFSREIRFEVSVYETDKKVRVVPLSTKQPLVTMTTVLDKYELRPYNLRYSGRFCTRSLMIKTRWECCQVSTTLSSFLGSPDGNYAHLRFLDTGRVGFALKGEEVLPRLPSLAVLRSVPEVAVRLLRAFSTPALQELTLVDNVYGGGGNGPDHRAVADILELLGKDYRYLRSLRFQFYPHWLDLFKFLAGSRLYENRAEYRLALPSYPSRLILTLLVDALKGELAVYSIKDPKLPQEPCSFNEFKEGRQDKRGCCYYCFCSHRMDCTEDSKVTCARHSKDAPIEITKYSLM
ncbi:SubName: Full=Uncharacterized protein {ECO:0000313/EMBL:CCA69050.1} [Serendipita indica DSM 11827]|uniref:TNFR-Cys domain-containing protein n=1 Tax=Serendipita indica (strain DSM 11827) TaxID=1109443 RepID=G4TCJ3_SERID|nr:SubName: Full=Uncharacterized protein {ECO:0000313/EMBL:CCA69050.1} [Serendipita indica DSM 11827]CCA69050.1 hypothetical protein PIIN_02909 [Serendipita indica DSM 11827]